MEVALKFAPGEVVVVQPGGVRGVIIEVDEFFRGSDEKLRDVTIHRGPKRRPWYYVLMEKGEMIYVAECHLASDPSRLPVQHPRLDEVFIDFVDGRYHLLTH